MGNRHQDDAADQKEEGDKQESLGQGAFHLGGQDRVDNRPSTLPPHTAPVYRRGDDSKRQDFKGAAQP